MNQHKYLLGLAALAFGVAPAFAAEPVPSADLTGVEVTATRMPEPVSRVPVSITVIAGDELRARGAHDLRTALSLVAGVEAPPGGDAGPASAVPSLWGLHEFDAFLLVVDGIPWGGAFNPSIPTLDLNNVEKIEVLRGAAPVVYGATAFVGVIQVIHYAAGEAADRAQLSYGSYGSVSGEVAKALPQVGGYRQSFALSAQRQRFSDPREQINNGKFMYRGAAPLLGGTLGLDSDIVLQRQAPPSPRPLDPGNNFVTPIDANFNPADARIDEHKYHFALRYSHETPLGLWDTTASYAHSNVADVRGFIRARMIASDPGDRGNNADYQNQDRGIIDSYFDTHLSQELAEDLGLVYGADLLYGSGKQESTNGAYCAGGSAAPYGCQPDQAGPLPQPTGQRPVDEIGTVDDRRAFLGQYANLDWKPGQRWDLNGGLRISETHERKTSTHASPPAPGLDAGFPDYETKNKTRLSGAIGVSYEAWNHGTDQAVVFADYRNTFKPAALDFGPDTTPPVLEPESARSYELGIKGRLFDGRLEYDGSLFYLHFNNLVVQSAPGPGAFGPTLENAGSSRFKGFEIETRYRLRPDLKLALNYSYHDTRFISFSDRNEGDVSGNQQTLAPHVLAAAGLLYAPRQGPYGSLLANYVGNRFLKLLNDGTRTRSYVSLDATLGYHWRRYEAALRGYNLSKVREPVSGSEFGDSSLYLLPARSLMFTLGADL